MAEFKKLRLRHSSGEWKIIEENIALNSDKALKSFLRLEIFKIKNKFLECPECICYERGKKKVEKEIFLSEEEYEILNTISIKMEKPIATIIEEFIIAPLLKPAI